MVRRFLRQKGLVPRNTHLVVKVFPDEVSAFQAYRLLNYHGISPEHLTIVGEGYSRPERIGLLRPIQIIVRKAVGWAIVSAIVGTVVATALFWLIHSQLEALAFLRQPSWAMVGSSMMIIPMVGFSSGLLGAAIGTFLGAFGGGTVASLYRHHISRGHYLLLMEGSENLVRWGQEVLGHYSTSRLY
ncbi:hypothetical protein H6G21_10415 [Alkalinema sp. FACHB-956]|nr:hypothetical protein [Alkalinema sp. FACHB-956]